MRYFAPVFVVLVVLLVLNFWSGAPRFTPASFDHAPTPQYEAKPLPSYGWPFAFYPDYMVHHRETTITYDAKPQVKRSNALLDLAAALWLLFWTYYACRKIYERREQPPAA